MLSHASRCSMTTSRSSGSAASGGAGSTSTVGGNSCTLSSGIRVMKFGDAIEGEIMHDRGLMFVLQFCHARSEEQRHDHKRTRQRRGRTHGSAIRTQAAEL